MEDERGERKSLTMIKWAEGGVEWKRRGKKEQWEEMEEMEAV